MEMAGSTLKMETCMLVGTQMEGRRVTGNTFGRREQCLKGYLRMGSGMEKGCGYLREIDTTENM